MLGKPSPEYFGAAVEAIDADPELTWMVGDDLEGDVGGAQSTACAPSSCEPGSSAPTSSSRRVSFPTGSSRRSRSSPTGSSRTSDHRARRHRPDRDRPRPPRARAARRRLPRARCFTAGERAYCDSKPNPPQHYAGRFAAKEAVGKALGSGVYFTWKEIEIVGRPKPGVQLSGRTARYAERIGAGRDRAVDDALARAGGRGRGRARGSGEAGVSEPEPHAPEEEAEAAEPPEPHRTPAQLARRAARLERSCAEETRRAEEAHEGRSRS